MYSILTVLFLYLHKNDKLRSQAIFHDSISSHGQNIRLCTTNMFFGLYKNAVYTRHTWFPQFRNCTNFLFSWHNNIINIIDTRNSIITLILILKMHRFWEHDTHTSVDNWPSLHTAGIAKEHATDLRGANRDTEILATNVPTSHNYITLSGDK